MPSAQDVKDAVAVMLSGVEDLQREMDRLQHAREEAAAANVNYLNPIAFDLLLHQVAQLSELSKQQSVDLAVSEALKDTVNDIESSAQALTMPLVQRAQ